LRYGLRVIPQLSVSKNHPAQQCPSLLLEEKVSPVHTLVTDVVENVTISPAVWYKAQHFAAHHISQKSVPKCRFLPASPRGEAFFPVLYFFDSLGCGMAFGSYRNFFVMGVCGWRAGGRTVGDDGPYLFMVCFRLLLLLGLRGQGIQQLPAQPQDLGHMVIGYHIPLRYGIQGPHIPDVRTAGG